MNVIIVISKVFFDFIQAIYLDIFLFFINQNIETVKTCKISNFLNFHMIQSLVMFMINKLSQWSLHDLGVVMFFAVQNLHIHDLTIRNIAYYEYE